ncbi:hypothetical protein C8R43DRAFT_1012924 [Mycena crocata]|nr:hypothetical protein C8R43DRAFT_1012924 [Mycena crocata]
MLPYRVIAVGVSLPLLSSSMWRSPSPSPSSPTTPNLFNGTAEAHDLGSTSGWARRRRRRSRNPSQPPLWSTSWGSFEMSRCRGYTREHHHRAPGGLGSARFEFGVGEGSIHMYLTVSQSISKIFACLNNGWGCIRVMMRPRFRQNNLVGECTQGILCKEPLKEYTVRQCWCASSFEENIRGHRHAASCKGQNGPNYSIIHQGAEINLGLTEILNRFRKILKFANQLWTIEPEADRENPY